MAGAFDDFAEDAADLFGLDERESAALLEELEGDGFDPEDDVLADWVEEAYDHLEDVSDDFSPYDLDPYFPDDDWLDAGDTWEVTADYWDN